MKLYKAVCCFSLSILFLSQIACKSPDFRYEPLYGMYPSSFHPDSIKHNIDAVVRNFHEGGFELSVLSKQLWLDALTLASKKTGQQNYEQLAKKINKKLTSLQGPLLLSRQEKQLDLYRLLIDFSLRDERTISDPLLVYRGVTPNYPDSLTRVLTTNVNSNMKKILMEIKYDTVNSEPDYLSSCLFLFNATWATLEPVGMLWLDHYRVPIIRTYLAIDDLLDNAGNLQGASIDGTAAAAFLLASALAYELSVHLSYPAPYVLSDRYKKDLFIQQGLIANMPMPNKDTSLFLMRKAAEAQFSNLFGGDPADPQNPDRGWVRGTFAAGIVSAWSATGDEWYLDKALQIANTANWEPGHQAMYDANDLAISQSYLELFEKGHPAARIQPTRIYLDSLIEEYNPEHVMWSWCDALFMAPPTWAGMGKVSGEYKYFDHMDKLWWQTSNLLYDTTDHLFYRDLTYVVKEDGFQLRERNGEKIFWGRGNGWVIGALPRVLDNLPANYPTREKYEAMFAEMCHALIKVQQESGLWSVSLLDAESYPMGDVSISTFACYAFAWGINQGLLDAELFIPAALDAWRGILACLDPDSGQLGYVQLPGDSRLSPIFKESNYEYATGALLLAGSEVIPLLN